MAMKQITKGYPNWDVPYNENVEEYNNTIGNVDMGTTATTITGAIKEIKELAETEGSKIQTVVADVNNNKTKIAEHTTQLNENTQEINNLKTLENWNSAVLQNGWTSDNEIGIRYFKVNNIVHINARCISGTVEIGTLVTNLPSGYRPLTPLMLPLYSSTDGSINYLVIQPDGKVIVQSSSKFTASNIVLGNLCYRGEC